MMVLAGWLMLVLGLVQIIWIQPYWRFPHVIANIILKGVKLNGLILGHLGTTAKWVKACSVHHALHSLGMILMGAGMLGWISLWPFVIVTLLTITHDIWGGILSLVSVGKLERDAPIIRGALNIGESKH